MKNSKQESIYFQNNIEDQISDIDSIIFDCDGVLIDVTKSYDIAIKQTTEFILKEIANIDNSDPVTSEIIDGFKATGGFNDEVDLTYAAILSLASANKLNKPGNNFVLEVIDNADQTGIKSVEKYLETKVDISDLKKKLKYPGRHLDNPIYSMFDQLFYGPELYSKLFKEKSKFADLGLIENDEVLLTKEMIQSLKKKFDYKLAIVTGRGIESISYSLKDFLEEFDLKNSAFLEDEPRSLAKPNPDSLIRSIRGLGSSHCLYVGDSMEDFIMAQKASTKGHKTTFCGIFGTSKSPEQKKKLFQENNVSIIIESIALLPKALNLV
jgi:HAD superfamily hydrolase (TIGR01548 family)